MILFQVKVSLDGEDVQFLTQVDKTTLFILKWNSSKYLQGLHRIQVTAEVRRGTSGANYANRNSD